ncbi:MAG: hypothetical protein WCD75_10015 [Rhodoplanes sp.]
MPFFEKAASGLNPLRPRTPPPQPSPACGGGSNPQRRGRGWPAASVAALAGFGFALTLYVFYPGVMTYDALYVYKAIAEGRVGDWQSPVMTALWAAVDPIAPGAGSMLLLTAALYWLGFGLVGITLARRAPWLGVVAVLLAFAPPAFMFLGVIWRDMLFAGVWLCAAALVFAAATARSALCIAAQAVALALVALGVMLRPNALVAAPLLATYALWPSRFAWKRVALAYVPAGLILFGVMHVVYYDVLGAVRQHPLHSLFVFDLGGITHFSKKNQFPTTWSPAEQQRLVTDCYDPYLWDAYWHGRPCSFVMGRIENEQHIFGTPVLSAAWRRALLSHPAAYLQHRATFMGTFLLGSNFTIWTQDISDPNKLALPDNRGFVALVAVSDVLKPTPLFRVALWLLLCGAICILAWRRRETPAGAFALAVAGSAVVYVLTYALVGVAADFRYAYWAVPAALTAGAAVIAGWIAPRARAVIPEAEQSSAVRNS